MAGRAPYIQQSNRLLHNPAGAGLQPVARQQAPELHVGVWHLNEPKRVSEDKRKERPTGGLDIVVLWCLLCLLICCLSCVCEQTEFLSVDDDEG